MKSKIFVVCMICALSATTSIYGYSSRKVVSDYNKVILDFIDSHMKSDYKKLNNVLDEDASFKIPRGERVIIQSKASLIDQMKYNQGTQQNCEPKYEVLAKSDAIVIARVDFKYENCTQHDFVVIEKNNDKEWKITQVCKIFEDAPEPADTPTNVTASNYRQ